MTKLKAMLAALALAGATGAQAAVLDFEGLSNGALVDGFSFMDNGITVTATLSVIGGANEARIFDTDLTGTADPDLEAPFLGGGALRPGNVLIIQEEAGVASAIPDDNADGGVITFTFDRAVNFLGLSVLDDATLTISSDGSGLTRRPSITRDGAGRNFAFRDDIFGDLTRLTIDFNGASGAIDNLSFAAVPAVPLPAALPMLLAGLGGLAWLGRRRKSA